MLHYHQSPQEMPSSSDQVRSGTFILVPMDPIYRGDDYPAPVLASDEATTEFIPTQESGNFGQYALVAKVPFVWEGRATLRFGSGRACKSGGFTGWHVSCVLTNQYRSRSQQLVKLLLKSLYGALLSFARFCPPLAVPFGVNNTNTVRLGREKSTCTGHSGAYLVCSMEPLWYALRYRMIRDKSKTFRHTNAIPVTILTLFTLWHTTWLYTGTDSVLTSTMKGFFLFDPISTIYHRSLCLS